jgi:hypothetical protein
MSKRFDRIGVYPDEMDKSDLERSYSPWWIQEHQEAAPSNCDNSAPLKLSLILSGSIGG